MKQLIPFILMLTTSMMANAQIGIYSMSQDRSTPVDTARYKVTELYLPSECSKPIR